MFYFTEHYESGLLVRGIRLILEPEMVSVLKYDFKATIICFHESGEEQKV